MDSKLFLENSHNPIQVARTKWNRQECLELREMRYSKQGELLPTKSGVLLNIADFTAKDTFEAMLRADGTAIFVHDKQVRVWIEGGGALDVRHFYDGRRSHQGICIPRGTITPVLQAVAELLDLTDWLTEQELEPEQPLLCKGNLKLAARLRGWIERLPEQIEDQRRPITANPTPKRMRQYQQRLHDAANLERAMWAMEGLAEAHETDSVPPELIALRFKGDILTMTCTCSVPGLGHYEYEDSGKFSDTTPAAQALQVYILSRTDPEAAKRAEIEKLEAKAMLWIKQIPGFFPTPEPVIRILLGYADVRAGMKVLEPSAGRGDIADALKATGAQVDVCEINYRLADILEKKGYLLVDHDFVGYALDRKPTYERIVMNPPFERGQDFDHIKLAYGLLVPGGRLVSVAASNNMTRSSGKKYEEFRQWLESVNGYFEMLPDNSFITSGTTWDTVVIIIDCE